MLSVLSDPQWEEPEASGKVGHLCRIAASLNECKHMSRGPTAWQESTVRTLCTAQTETDVTWATGLVQKIDPSHE